MKAIRVHEYGGPEVLRLDELEHPVPNAGEVLVRVAVAGVNFFDTQLRSGLYRKQPLPVALGSEGAGTVEAVGAGVTAVRSGDRVGWALVPGAYATHAVVPADRTVLLPETVSFEAAAATLYQGITAHHLACSTYPLGPDDTCLVYSAAGGVGSLLCQIAKMRGATVIAAVSSSAKLEAARAAGADHVLVYGDGDLAAEVRRLTGGRGVDVVYDAVGKETFAASLDSLRLRGFFVLYGEASGLVPELDVRLLLAKGSLYLTRTGLPAYVATPEEFAQRAGDVLRWLAGGTLRSHIGATYALDTAAEAHRAMEDRRTIGKLLLRCGATAEGVL